MFGLLLALTAPSLASGGDRCAPLARAFEAIDAAPRCLTAALATLETEARAQGLADCADEGLRARGLAPLPPALPQPLPPPPGGGKTERDLFNVPNVYLSDNVAVRWGDGFSTNEAAAVAASFEEAWAVELVEMELPTPYGLDQHYLNVYIGGTGRGTPSASGAAGYFTRDGQGHPMIVLALSTAQEVEGRGEGTIAHELFHALQDAASAYQYTWDGPGSWYFEATASWVEVEVHPDSLTYAEPLFGFSFFPHLPLNHFDYPDTGALTEYHQYGAFIFPLYLSEHVGDWRIVRSSWLDTRGERDPLVVIDRILREEFDSDLQAAFADFTARNATWDYRHGEIYGYYHDQMEDYYPRDSFRETMRHVGSTEGLARPVEALRPRAMGANYLVLRSPSGGPDLRVRFQGERAGSEGSAGRWAVSVSAMRGDDFEVEHLSLPLPEEGVVLEGFGEADEVWMSVASLAEVFDVDETFDFTYAMEPVGATVEPEDSDPVVDSGLGSDAGGGPCGCASGPRGLPGALAGLALLAALRRRQR